MEQDKVRAEFEAAYRKARYDHVDGFDLRRLGDAYQCEHAQFAWDMWKASREAVVVELPSPFVGDDFTMYDGAEMLEAIHDAGIRTK